MVAEKTRCAGAASVETDGYSARQAWKNTTGFNKGATHPLRQG